MRSFYIHIPFCESICSYCDFCKYFYNEKQVNQYLNDLEKELDTIYQNDVVKTIYIGGGTPSCLNLEQLNHLFKIVKKIKTVPNLEFTVECNIENITEEKLRFFYQNNVNRLSIGIQSFQKKNLEILNRHHTYQEVKEKIALARKIGFQNINVDLIYAIIGQTKKDLFDDLEKFLSLEVEHISTYSLMIEPHTKLFLQNVEPISQELDEEMYHIIVDTLKKHGYEHYEVSNFSRLGYASFHNLTYWNNEEYYGIGVGSSGYLDGVRYTNTKSLEKYHNGFYRIEEEKLTKQEELENTFLLGLRKIKGISKQQFLKKYGKDIHEVSIVRELLEEKKLCENTDFIYIPFSYIYIENQILYRFLENTNLS